MTAMLISCPKHITDRMKRITTLRTVLVSCPDEITRRSKKVPKATEDGEENSACCCSGPTSFMTTMRRLLNRSKANLG